MTSYGIDYLPSEYYEASAVLRQFPVSRGPNHVKNGFGDIALGDRLTNSFVGKFGACAQRLTEPAEKGPRHSQRDVALKIDPTSCLVCGRGLYIEEITDGRIELMRVSNQGARAQNIFVRLFCCNVCTHRALFAPGFPDEAAARGWKTM